MARRSCDGAGLRESFRAAVTNLEAHVDEVNALNVYPVPDGDTGSNMVATVRAALDEAGRTDAGGVDRVAAALSFGALMGARGNSGVIASQILRGIAEGLASKRHFNALDLAHALTVGTQTAYAAVGQPVEGTILTVIREAAAAARAAAERENDLEHVLAVTVEAAGAAVAATPSLLPVLREAGVVDAGGQGLLRLLEGALAYLRGTATPVGAGAPGAGQARGAGPAARPSTLVSLADEGFGYETMFLVQPRPGQALDVDAIRARLGQIGESVLVAGDQRGVKVHVHSERPDEVLSLGLSLGVLSRISVESLDQQAHDVREGRAASFAGGVIGEAGGGVGAPGEVTGGVGTPGEAPTLTRFAAAEAIGADRSVAPATAAAGEEARRRLAVVAVAAGDGLAAIFKSYGVAAIVRGGQAANPSTGELLAAIDALEADEVLLLPNNPNVILAARQVVSLARLPVRVVETRNAAEGVAALLALDPSLDGASNVASMTSAARSIQTLLVTDAVRDAKIGSRKVKKGQTIVLDPDDGLVAVDSERSRALLGALATLRPGYELITLYYGDGADLAETEGVAKLIAGWRPDLEVEVIYGGQPHYRYLVAAE